MRRGAIIANGQRTEISQAAGDCDLSLGAELGQLRSVGRHRDKSRCARRAACARGRRRPTPSGCGSARPADKATAPCRSTCPLPPARRAARPSTSPDRSSASSQSEGCTYAINPASLGAGPSGTSGAIAITTAAACPWTAASNVRGSRCRRHPEPDRPRLGHGRGDRRAGRAPARRSSPGRPSPSTQSQGCTYGVQPANTSVGAAGGTVTVSITANRECEWSATSNDSLDHAFRDARPERATERSRLAAAATTGPARSGSAVVAGQTHHDFPDAGMLVRDLARERLRAVGGRDRQGRGHDRRRLQLDGVEQRLVADHHVRDRPAAATAKSSTARRRRRVPRAAAR